MGKSLIEHRYSTPLPQPFKLEKNGSKQPGRHETISIIQMKFWPTGVC